MEVKRGRSGSVVDGGFTTPTKETQKRGERMLGPRVDDTPYINASLRYLGGPRQTKFQGQERESTIRRAALLGLPSNGACLTPMKVLDRRPGVSPTIHNEPVRIPPMVGRFAERTDLNRRGIRNNPYTDKHDDRHEGNDDPEAFEPLGRRDKELDDFVRRNWRPFDQGPGERSVCFGVKDARKNGAGTENVKDRGGVSGGDAPARRILGSRIGAEELTTLGDEWKEACTVDGRIYFYNRRTREPRWKLPPGATYIPDPSRPAGYRIFAITATCPKGSDADTSPVGACYEKGAQRDRATERVEGDCLAAGSTSMLGGRGRSSSAERHKVMSTDKSTRRGRDGQRSPEKGVTREYGLHSRKKGEERREFIPSKTSTTRTRGSRISRGKDTRGVKKGVENSAGIVIRGDELVSAKEAWTSPTDHPDSSEEKTASDELAVIDEREGGPVNRVFESFGPEKSQGKHHGWLERGRRSRAVCTDPGASSRRVQRGTLSSNSDASEGEDEAQAYPQTRNHIAFVPHTASSASPSNNSSSFCCSTSGIKETAVDGRRQRVGVSSRIEATDDGARRCSASRDIPLRRTSLSPGNASAAQATGMIGIGARPADLANGAAGALDSGERTINASPTCGDFPVICTGVNPIDAGVVTTASAKCGGVTPARTEAHTTVTGADAVGGEFLRHSRSGHWSSSPPSSLLSLAVSPVPHQSFSISPFNPDDDTVLRRSSKSPQAGRCRPPLESPCTPLDGIASRYREDETFATSTAAACSKIENPSAFTDQESPLTPPQDNDVGVKSVGMIVQKISSRRGELGEPTVSRPLEEDSRVKNAAGSDTTRTRLSLRTPVRFRNEKKSVAFRKEVSDPVPYRIGMTESVVVFENDSPCVTVHVEDARVSLTSCVAAAHGIVDSGESDNSLGAVLEGALQLKSRGIGALMGLGRNESADASCQCFKAGDSTECSPSSTSLMQNYARCIRAASGGVDASPTSPTPVTAVTCAESGGRSLLPNRVECMAGATLSTVDEPSSPASDGGGKRCHGRATADARPDAVRNESGINCGTLRNEDDNSSTFPRSVTATAPGTPPTAILTISRDGDMGATKSEPATRSTCRFAAAQTQAKEKRIELRTEKGGHDGDFEGEKGLPGSSVVRHKVGKGKNLHAPPAVRRQLFSEASEARPMVFCPFCGDGVLASGRLREHLEVEAAIRAVSGKGKKPSLRARGSGDEDPCEAAGTYSAKDKISLDKAASSMREVASSATVPSDGNNSTTDEALEAQEENRKESFISDRREPSFVSLVENSLAGTKISSDGREMERCEGCGRTFAPGRLHSHAKACRSVFMERRQQYDPKAKRAKGTPLEFFQRPIATTPPKVKVKASTPTDFPPTANSISTVKAKDSSASTAATQSDRNRNGSFNDRFRNKRALKKLPPVEGISQCPFCSESVPRVKLSGHLLRCDNLRKTRNNRVAPKAPTNASYIATPSITSSGVRNQNTGGDAECPVTAHPKAQVRCPHCMREFAPSTAPTHVAICARVENRPRSSSLTRAQGGARKGRAFRDRLRVEKGDIMGVAVRRRPFY